MAKFVPFPHVPEFMCRFTFVSVFPLLSAIYFLLSVVPADAQPNARSALIALAPLSGAGKIEMIAQTLDVDVVESGEGTALVGQMLFKLHNTDRLAGAELSVGFPSWGGGAQELNEKSFTQFTISQNGRPIQPEWQTQPITLNKLTRNVRWLAWSTTMAEDERAIIQVSFRQELGDQPLPTFVFAQAPAILWKGYVGSARYTVRFPWVTTPEEFRQIAPKGSEFDGQRVSWLFSDFNPDEPILLQFIKPRFWREVVAARRALGQNGDVPAALRLGSIFLQLARASFSASDLSQAMAAFQRASEIDSSSPSAPLELAQIYEAKLRGEFGPLGDENAVRASALEQWERVLKLSPTNLEARDAVAQHSFALAQLARRNKQFNGALALLERTRNSGSNKIAQPQIDSEVRANEAGRALQQIEAGEWHAVLSMIESRVFGVEAQREWQLFQPRFSSLQAVVVVAGEQQQLNLRLVPVPFNSERHEQLLKQWTTSLYRQTQAEGQLAFDGGSYLLTVSTTARPLLADEWPTIDELTLAHELLAPPELRVIHKDELFGSNSELIAHYSFTETQRVAQGKMQAIERALATLRTPINDEAQEQVRRVRVSALEWYRTGWQSLMNSSTVRIEWWGNSGKAEQVWDLRPGESRTLQAQRSRYHPWLIIGVMGVGVVLVVLVVGIVGRMRPSME